MSKPIAFPVNQFVQANRMLNQIPGMLIRPTVTFCHHCYQHIPGFLYVVNNQLWMIKQCRLHGVSYHMIERDYSWLKRMGEGAVFQTDRSVLIEVSDRCNVDCPHCYHMPDNRLQDRPRPDLVQQVGRFYQPEMDVCLTGAEATMRRDLPELIADLVKAYKKISVSILTNGIRFADKEFLAQCLAAGLTHVRLGLNHPSYLGNEKIRQKQLASIDNLRALGQRMSYISYTMSSMNELTDILEETTASNWKPGIFRIRYGSDIGRYPEQPRMYVSDIFKITQQWCKDHGKRFEIMHTADNNIYHVMVKINEQPFRLIQWCDETDIDMEELRCGPWCDFVPDGITNFLHQIIRRDISKNRGIILPDRPPDRYLLANVQQQDPLDFSLL